MMAGTFKKLVFYVLVLAVSLVTSYSVAIAQVNFTNNEGQFIAANPGLAFQNFDSVMADPGLLVTCSPAPVDENSNDFCFQPGDIIPGIAFAENPGLTSNEVLVLGQGVFGNNNPPNVLTNNTFVDSLEVLFTQTTTHVGLNLGCISTSGTCNETIVAQVFGPGDVLLDSTDVAVTDLVNSFIGIQSVVPITRIDLEFTVVSNQEIKSILNVRFGIPIATNIPTLSEWGLIATAGLLGIVGFMVAKRRQSIV